MTDPRGPEYRLMPRLKAISSALSTTAHPMGALQPMAPEQRRLHPDAVHQLIPSEHRTLRLTRRRCVLLWPMQGSDR